MTKPMRNIPTASELQEPEKERQLKRLPMRYGGKTNENPSALAYLDQA